MKQQLHRAIACLALCALLAGAVPPASAAGQFQDVPASHPAAEAIQRCVELGFFQGESAARFGVGHSITRGAFVVAASRFFGWDTKNVSKTPTYSDVPAGTWCYGAVEAAAACGALSSQSGTFRPNDAITREELAVLLVRALGYETVAALAQDLATPFRDVRTNPGYIAMAYDFGLVSGGTRTQFSPDEPAAREDVAVILMELYDKLHAPAARSIGIASSEAELPDLAGYETVAISAGRLMCAGKPSVPITMEAGRITALQETIRQAGAKAFLHVVGGPTALNGDTDETMSVLAEAVEKGGYDGLLLDLEKLKSTQESAMSRLMRALRPALDGKPLYVIADAPAWDGTAYEGYNYGLIGENVDCLILRVSSHKGLSGDFPTAPVEPLEEAYYALGELRGVIDGDKLALLVTTDGTLYLGGRESGGISQAEIRKLLTADETKAYYSTRYDCAYASSVYEKREAVVWYLNDRAIEARARLAGLFGVTRLCMADLNDLPAEMPET
ncbi:S-layer homology domain-containing protein [Oscillospiraceae bacterium 50-60]|nr:hypothetical protein [Oscillibacter sp.]